MSGVSEQRWYAYYVVIVRSMFHQEQRRLNMFSLMYGRPRLASKILGVMMVTPERRLALERLNLNVVISNAEIL